jgi:hypothetical protein
MSLIGDLFGTKAVQERSVILNVVGSKTVERDYINSIKTNRKVAREIYHNVNKNYALAGQLVRPIINNNVNFIGIPTLFGNKKNIKVIEDANIDYRSVHKSAEIDGSIFVWPQWKDDKIELVKVPVDIIDRIFISPITKSITGYRLKEQVQYSTEKADNQSVVITCIITKDYIRTTFTGSVNKIVNAKNILGELPLVHFSNDKDDLELYGHSEIEPIEPQLKFYHNLTFEAGSAQSRDGHPKLKVTTKKPQQWVDNNFGSGAYESLVKNGGSISMGDRDLFINGDGDDVSYLYLNKTTGDYGQLSETTFSNIVEGSETPEINFGANIGTSLASVKEYRPVWIKKIEAKQYERTEPWLKVYKLILALHNFVNLKSLKSDIVIVWPTPNFASVKEQSEIVKGFSSAVDSLKAAGVVTEEEVYNTMKELDIFELSPTYIQHKKVIDEEVKIREQKAKAIADAAKAASDKGTEEDNEDNTNQAKE